MLPGPFELICTGGAMGLDQYAHGQMLDPSGPNMGYDRLSAWNSCRYWPSERGHGTSPQRIASAEVALLSTGNRQQRRGNGWRRTVLEGRGRRSGCHAGRGSRRGALGILATPSLHLDDGLPQLGDQGKVHVVRKIEEFGHRQ